MRTLLLLISLFLCCPTVSGTTIAFDGQEMVSDSQITAGTTKYLNYTGFQKIVRIKNKVVGCAGSISEALLFRAWIEHPGTIRPKAKELQALVWDETGCWEYVNSEVPVKINAPFALGTGADFAVGAMEAGASARKAVEISSRWDLFTAGTVKAFRLKPQKVICKTDIHLILDGN